MNEEELILGCKNGDRSSQKALYDKYASKMLAICMRYVGERMEAEDVLQDAFVKIDEDLPHQAFDEGLIERIDAKAILKIITLLPDGYRQIFNLYAVEGYKHQEIGKMLGISEGTSKSQYARAKKHLQELILKHYKIDIYHVERGF
ncbi:MAG: RNA polymerase sigma factor [Bacteroidetes bacterium]|nr:RNA polymerase sigma factor [Bacteroidota bacterium]